MELARSIGGRALFLPHFIESLYDWAAELTVRHCLSESVAKSAPLDWV